MKNMKHSILHILEKLDKKEKLNKWSGIIENIDSDKVGWLEQYTHYISDDTIYNTPIKNIQNDDFPSLLPISMRVAAKTIGLDLMGTGKESDKRIKKRIRINKLKRVLGEDEFNNVVSKEEYDEIQEIKKDMRGIEPMSAPSPTLMYLDFKYGDDYDDDEDDEKKINFIIIKL